MYVSGFLSPVPTGNKKKYADHARKAWPLFREYGVLSMMEAWGVDVPEGKLTDFRKAVALEDGEMVVFSWLIWPDKETAAKCMASMESDERWQAMMDMPFDGKRMVFGDFEPIFSAEA